MEKSIESLTESLNLTFRLSDRDWNQYSPLTLAYMGDAAYELVIRSIFVKRANMQVNKLHQQVIACVSAKTQCRMIQYLLPFLNEEETAIYRRGRNSKPYTKAKNASLDEYLEATGLEAVIGFLYLKGEFNRMNELIRMGLAELDLL